VSRSESFVVADSEGGQRLDRLIAQRGGVGRRRARELCEAGRVSVDGRRGDASDTVPAGALVAFDAPPDGAEPDAGAPLDVRLETDQLVVAYKPAGQPTAPLRTGERGTLANALLARYPEMATLGRQPREPGLVHRLDTQTSGLVVAARTADAFERLSDALERGRLEKRYLAIVGNVELPVTGAVDTPLAPDPRRKGRVVAVADCTPGYARTSLTRFRVLERRSLLALVELTMSKGFRHQIRAHLASVGAPLVGDALYGGPAWPEHPGRHALHASYVAWAGDGTLTDFAVEAEMPDDMRELFGR
jgi:23S rRNA pseudouridine1911/1915/1917 synthase